LTEIHTWPVPVLALFGHRVDRDDWPQRLQCPSSQFDNMSLNLAESSGATPEGSRTRQYTESGLPILIPNLKPLPPDVWKPTKHLTRPEPPPPPPDLGPAAGQF
jgi:hypothetical protein